MSKTPKNRTSSADTQLRSCAAENTPMRVARSEAPAYGRAGELENRPSSGRGKGGLRGGSVATLRRMARSSLEASRPRAGHHKPARRGKRDLLALELCAGGGGAALGLEQAGFTHAALIEYDRHACATLRSNRPYWNVIEADIRRFDASYWHGIDLLSGGLPCPPFSIAGKQLGPDDDRDMFPAMLRIVQQTEPRAILIENVRGILTEKFREFRDNIGSQLDDLGYDSSWSGFDAADFGVPQTRYRAFLVAVRRDDAAPVIWPSAAKRRAAGQTVGSTLRDLMAARGWHGADEWAANANGIAPTIVGGSHKHGGPDLGPTRARREWAELGVDGLGLANEAPAQRFRGMPRLTVPMVARLQSFPDEWIFSGAKTHSYRQVGNALPVRLGAVVASAVQACLT